MRKTRSILTVLGLLTLALPTLSAASAAASEKRFAAAPTGTEAITGRYLVLLEETAIGSPAGRTAAHGVREVTRELARGFTFHVQRTWSDALTGFVAKMTEAEARRLARHPFVARVQQDYSVRAISAIAPSCYAFGTHPANTRDLPEPASGVWSQAIDCNDPSSDCIDNWGLDRIDERRLPLSTTYTSSASGAGTYVVIFDTGVDDHREWENLSGASRLSRSLSKSFVSEDPLDIDDGSGHGTHVTGIAAARTYGVAKLATIVMVRVCRPSGMCTASHVTSGFNYVAGLKNSFPTADAVGSLSANDPVWRNDLLIHKAVSGLLKSGIQLVQSAGNDGEDACLNSFGQATDTFVVGGTDSSDSRFDYPLTGVESNYGTCVDLFAPAQEIVATSTHTFNDDSYCQLTGTSMAAPHVAGALALYLEKNPGATPAQQRSWLLSSATRNRLSNIGPGSPNRLLYNPY